VRCDHCHDKTADERRRFCEYCGRQLSRPEENPIETATTALDDLIDASSPSFVEESIVAPVETVSGAPQSARCESCGGPAGEADLCDACQRAFHAVIESKRPETSVEADETEDDDFEDDEIEDGSPAPRAGAGPSVEPTPPIAATAPVVAPFNPWAASPSFSTAHADAPSAQPAAPTTQSEAPKTPVEVPDVPRIGFVPLPPPVVPAAVAAPAPPPAAPPVAVRQPVPARELTRPMPRPRPVPPGGLPNASPAPSSGRTRALFVAGALVVVALAVCVPLATPWLASEQPVPAPHEEPPPEPSAQEAVARHTPAPKRAEPVVDDIAPDPEPPRPVRQPKPARLEPKRQPAPAPTPTIEAMTAATLPAPEPLAAPAPAPEPVAAPVGPFFETRQVNDAPQVASRIEPRIPDDIQGPLNDVVILRVLVSQTGHVSLVSVLRRSKSGVSVDDAVVAAVKQWRFSPARKRGEAVSCWYHVGIPVQRAN
jgi:TonB family protein